MFQLGHLSSCPYDHPLPPQPPRFLENASGAASKVDMVTSQLKPASPTMNAGQLRCPHAPGSRDLQCIIDDLITLLKAQADIVIISAFSWRALGLPGNRSQAEVNQRATLHM